jgi:predicted dehydrogenase
MDEVTIALVGIGGYGGFYLEQLFGDGGKKSQEIGARLIAGVDPYAEKSGNTEYFQHRNIPIYPDLSSFYQDNTADLVIIAAAIHFHAPLTCLALAQGSNVLCEKPLCATVSQAREMAQAESASGKFVAVGYQWSHSNAVQLLKNDIMAGILGKPVRLKTKVFWPRYASYYQRNDWAGMLKSPDGQWVLDSPMHNATAHYLHNMLYILGSQTAESAMPATIQAECYRANPITNFDTAALRCVTEQGIEILFYTSHAVPELIGPIFHYEFEQATVAYLPSRDNPDDPWSRRFIAQLRNGTTKDYGDPNEEDGLKIWQAIHSVKLQRQSNNGALPACGILASTPQVMCVNGAYLSREINDFPQEIIRHDESEQDKLTWAEGLQETFERCYAHNALPSELEEVSWATPFQSIPAKSLNSIV